MNDVIIAKITQTRIPATVIQPLIPARLSFDVIHVGYAEEYHGEYVVTPNFESTVLETKNKIMREDVEVEAIPVYRTSNPQGGKTIYIGGNLGNGE